MTGVFKQYPLHWVLNKVHLYDPLCRNESGFILYNVAPCLDHILLGFCYRDMYSDTLYIDKKTYGMNVLWTNYRLTIILGGLIGNNF